MLPAADLQVEILSFVVVTRGEIAPTADPQLVVVLGTLRKHTAYPDENRSFSIVFNRFPSIFNRNQGGKHSPRVQLTELRLLSHLP